MNAYTGTAADYTYTPETFAPAGWVSTFGLYNAGYLAGYWAPAGELPETVEAFRAAMIARGEWRAEYDAPDVTGEELWCFDVECDPAGGGECSPIDLNRWADAFDSAPIPAPLEIADVIAYASNYYGAAVTPNNWAEIVEEASERFGGFHDSIEDYAGELLEDCGMLADLPDWARSHEYALIASYARDMEAGGEIARDDAGRVWRTC